MASAEVARLSAENARKEAEIRRLLEELALEAGSAGWWTCAPCGLLNEKSFDECAVCFAPRPRQAQAASVAKPSTSTSTTDGKWTCAACTTRNAPTAVECGVCFADRPSATPTKASFVSFPSSTTASVTASVTATASAPPTPTSSQPPPRTSAPVHDTWTCPACTTHNAPHLVECAICFADRPSSSSNSNSVPVSPVATRTPAGPTTSPATTVWVCAACTTHNLAHLRECGVCFADRPAQPLAPPSGMWRCAACTTRNRAHETMCAMCLADRPTPSSAPASTTTTAAIIDLTTASGGREMLTPDRATALLSPYENQTVPKLRLSTKSFGLGAAQVAERVLRSLRGVREADLSDIIAGRPEEEALKVLVLVCGALSHCELEVLDLSDNALGEKGVRALSAALSGWAPRLREIRFRNNGLSALSMKLLCEALGSAPRLESMSFYSNMCGDGGAQAVADFVVSKLGRAGPLKDFCFSSSRVHAPGGEAMVRALAANAPNLERLDFSDSNFGGGEVGVLLATALETRAFPRLGELILRDTGIRGAALARIIRAACALPTLRVLDLGLLEISSKTLSGEGVLAAVSACSGLKQLLLVENELGDKGMDLLGQHLPPSLEVLDVSTNGVRGRAAVGIAKAFVARCRGAKLLGLNGNRVDAASIEAVKRVLGAGDKLGPMDENEAEEDD